MAAPWDPGRYKDQYRTDLLAAIHRKAETGATEPSHAPAERPGRAIDLVDLLEKSVASARGSRASKKPKKRPTRSRAA
jgi:DNA end-binding protein Ku